MGMGLIAMRDGYVVKPEFSTPYEKGLPKGSHPRLLL